MFVGTVLPVILIVIPFTINEPVGLINGAKLALLIVNEAVVKLVEFIIPLVPLTPVTVVASLKVPLTTRETNSV